MSDEVKTTEETQQAPVYDICPCCGKPTLIKPVVVKDALLDQYMACIISGVPFTHTYPIYNGRIKITVSVLDRATAGLVTRVTSLLEAVEDAADAATKDKIARILSAIRLYCFIDTITINAGDKTREYHPAATARDVCNQFLIKDIDLTEAISKQLLVLQDQQNVSNVPAAILMRTVEGHNQLNTILLTAGFDENFWEGIELA